MQFKLIGKPNIDWVAVAPYFEGKTTSGDLAGFYHLLGQLSAGIAEDHMAFTFYYDLPIEVITKILLRTRLKVTADMPDNVGFISGSYGDWLEAITTFCNKQSGHLLRGAFNVAVYEFERLGLTLPFAKIEVGDKTFETIYQVPSNRVMIK